MQSIAANEVEPLDTRAAVTLWRQDAGGLLESAVHDALVLRASADAAPGALDAWRPGMPATDPVLVPVSTGSTSAGPGPGRDGTAGVVAALVISWGTIAAAPPRSTGTRRNGVRLPAGMHLLRHGDRLEVGRRVLWVAASSTPREECYDPARHGADQFCFRLKSRFEPGDVLVTCPGAPGHACGMMYSRRAWDTGLACHACGWDPAAPAWRPPAHAPSTVASSARARLAALAGGVGDAPPRRRAPRRATEDAS